MLEQHSFLWLGSISLSGCSTFYLSMHLSPVTWVVSTFFVNNVVNVDVLVPAFGSFEYISRSKIAASYDNFMFDFLRNQQTLF